MNEAEERGLALQRRPAFVLRVESLAGEELALYSFQRELVLIGRSPTCHLWLPDSTVSRRQAELRCGPAGFELRALESTNPTRFKGAALAPDLSVKLSWGDSFQIAELARITLQPAPAEDATRHEGPPGASDTAVQKAGHLKLASGSRPSGKRTSARLRVSIAARERRQGREPDLERDFLSEQPSLFGNSTAGPQAPARPGEAQLAWLDATVKGPLPRSLALGDSLTLGGERECGLYLAGAPRRAALLVRLPEGYRIFNTGPLPSGLKVEGEEVSCSAELRGGERLNVWGQALRFELAPPA